MLIPKQTTIPALVRVKPGALDRMGIYVLILSSLTDRNDLGAPESWPQRRSDE